jgi:hypothetical protein
LRPDPYPMAQVPNPDDPGFEPITADMLKVKILLADDPFLFLSNEILKEAPVEPRSNIIPFYGCYAGHMEEVTLYNIAIKRGHTLAQMVKTSKTPLGDDPERMSLIETHVEELFTTGALHEHYVVD